ncbi:MAG: hypothetical protein ACRD1G_05565, partial [Acidimicrobiales bacterium]
MAIDSPELLVSSQSTAEQTSVFTSGALSRLKLIGMLATGATLGVACSSNHFVPPVQAQGTSDTTIINAAATAEALATVMYDNIINTSPAFKQLMTINNVNDQSYLVAGRVQETIHYNTLVGAGAKPLGLTFYYPTGMFTDAGFT